MSSVDPKIQTPYPAGRTKYYGYCLRCRQRSPRRARLRDARRVWNKQQRLLIFALEEMSSSL